MPRGPGGWPQSAGWGPAPRLGAPPSILDPVGQTARWVAAARAVESERPDRLFEDPYAAVLAGEEGQRGLTVLGAGAMPIVAYLAMRTVFLDEMIAMGLENGIRQVAILAAGMDSRAFRLNWPAGTRVYEVERPAVLAVKDGILGRAGAKPACERHTVSADLTGPWMGSLQAAGFDLTQPTIWLTEGLLMYLEPSDVHQLLHDITSLSALGSRLGGDVPNPPGRFWQSVPVMGGMPGDRPAVQRFGTTDPVALLCQYGWQADVESPSEVAARLQRPPVPPFILPNGEAIRNHLFRAKR